MAQRNVKSAERTLALLELFSREQRPFTVGRIARELAIPQPSASMLLRNMVELGYLEYDRDARTYTPSIRVALLGAWVDRRFSQAGEIGEHLGHLQRLSGETAFIAVQNGAFAQYVLAQTPLHPEQLEIQSGQYRSLTQSAVGRALLSLKPDKEVLTWARRCNAEAAEESSRVPERACLELVRGIRASGISETDGDIRPGFGALATTFRSPMGTTPLAVAIGGPSAAIRSRRDEFADALRAFKAVFERPAAPARARLDADAARAGGER